MKGHSSFEVELDKIPHYILDFFEYVYGTCIAPEINLFSIDGFNKRGWFYLTGNLNNSQIIGIVRQVGKKYSSLPKSYFRESMNKGEPLEKIAIDYLKSQS